MTERLEECYGDERAWQVAEDQSRRMGTLVSEGHVSGELLVLRRP